jgi:HSP20 family molecular chaperone IbpA
MLSASVHAVTQVRDLNHTLDDDWSDMRRRNIRELDHWLKAEAELLHPVHVQIWESGDALEVQAEVPGFNDKELEVSVEPFRIMISGEKESNEERKKRTTVYNEQGSNEVFRVIDLPVEVEATKATATLKNGILTLSAPKVAEAKTPKPTKSK